MSWPTVALGDLVEILSGFAFKSNLFNSNGEGLPLVRIRDVKAGVSQTFYDGPFQDKFLLSDDDLLVGMDGEFNCAPWAGGKALLNQRVCRVTAKSEKLDQVYLNRFLPTALKEIEDKTSFVTVKHLSAKQIGNIKIPLPPLPEQRRIAAILDQADALRRLRRQSLARLSDLGQAIFYEMFGDLKTNTKRFPSQPLGSVAQFFSGNSLPAGEAFTEQRSGYLLLKVSDLNHDRNQKDIVCAASWSPAPGSKAGTCPPCSIVFPKRGGAIATNKKRRLMRGAILDPNLMGIHPDPASVTLDYTAGWMESFNLTEIASGSSVPQLNKQDLAPLDLPIPPTDLQREYSGRLAKLNKIRSFQAKTLEFDDSLFASLQHRAFRGEL